jgi:hypothetical protein
MFIKFMYQVLMIPDLEYGFQLKVAQVLSLLLRYALSRVILSSLGDLESILSGFFFHFFSDCSLVCFRRKTELLTRADLELEWWPLYRLFEADFNSPYEKDKMIIRPKSVSTLCHFFHDEVEHLRLSMDRLIFNIC